jgi:hypothetical protein
MARDTAEALGWVPQDSKTVFTIMQHSEFPGSGDEEKAHPPRPSYSLGLGPPSTDVKTFDILLLEAMQDPTRNARYKLDAEKCAQIAQSLWLSVLPLWV